jgi:HAD superfamily hydrolase (TIGR01509 family)
MTHVRAVVVDLGGVVFLPAGHADPWTWLADRLGVSADAVRAALWHPGDIEAANIGEISGEEYAARAAARLGIESKRVLDAIEEAYAGMLNTTLVSRLRALRPHVTVAALTNNWTFLDRLLERQGIADVFHVVVNSAETRCRKPNAEIYRLLLERIGCRADEVVFFDDDLVNVVAAEALGFRAVHFTTPDAAIASLDEHVPLPRAPRPATIDDAARIAELQLASWRAAYVNELSAAYRDAQDIREWVGSWRSEIASGVNVFVVEEGDALLGFVACGPPRRGSAGIVGWEIYNIHTHPDRHGEGIGSMLFNAAVDLGRERGAPQLLLWVVKSNHSARAFYHRKGMRTDGREQEHRIGNEVLFEIRYRTTLAEGTNQS